MPTYSYACTACEHHFDTVQKFTDPSLTDCPKCTGRLRKLFSSVGIVFKGSGFYRNDSRSSPAESGSNGKSESSSNDKSESGSNGKPKPGSESGPTSAGSNSESKARPASASSSSTSTPTAAAS